MAKHSFDHYQRYHFIQEAVRLISNGRRLCILEVGAMESPLKEFLPEQSIYFLDEVVSVALDVRSNGLSLPFRDRTFDLVISTDTLEHIPAEHRTSLIQELQRVVRQALILGFPHQDSLNQLADKTLFEFIKTTTGKEFIYLKEHLENGLPDKEQIKNLLSDSMLEILEFPNANIYSWLLLQLQNFLLASTPEFQPPKELLEDFFIAYYEQTSHVPPCYRTFLISFKELPNLTLRQNLSNLNVHGESPTTDQFAETSFALSMSFYKALDQYRKEQTRLAEDRERGLQKFLDEIAQKDEKIKRKEEEIRSNEHELVSQYQRIRNLQNYLDLFLNHPVYKLYKSFKNLISSPQNYGAEPFESDYQRFIGLQEPDSKRLSKQRSEWKSWEHKPLLNLITAVYDPPLRIFKQTVESILAQTYGHWVWDIADASNGPHVWSYLMHLAETDPRLRPVRLSINGGISANSNIALKNADGDYIVMLDHDDTLAPFALYSVADVLRMKPEIDFIYSDSDKLDESGNRCEPLFKPDWSPELMLSFNLLGQLSVFRRSLLEKAGYLNGDLDGAQDWDLYLRIANHSDHIHHIPQILYHWRKTPHSISQSPLNKQNVTDAQQKALCRYLSDAGLIEPEIQFHSDHPGTSQYPFVKWKLNQPPFVSIIIPSRDHLDVLDPCLESLFSLTKYSRYEVILVDTGSTEPATWSYYDRYSSNPRFRLIEYKGDFNFGKASNLGAQNAKGDLLLFLNNDTQILQDDWLDLMVQWFCFPGVGIVGAKLLYPDARIQHGGVVVGMGGLASHLFLGRNEKISSIFGRDCWYRNLSAVTGACLLISRDVFDSVSGFDESYVLNYSDVDLCLKARESGYRIVYTPNVRLIHHESATHRREVPRNDFLRASERFRRYLDEGDPYFNRNLSYDDAFPQFTRGSIDTPKTKNDQLLARLPNKPLIILPEDLA